MNPNRWTKLALSATLAALAISLLPGAAAAAPAAPVYVLSGQSLSAQRADGELTVRLREPTRQVTSFHPGGLSPAINVTTAELVDGWRRLGFDEQPPLATIDPRGDRRKATLVRLEQPRLSGKGTVLTFSARPVDALAPQLANRLVDPADSVPAKAGATTLSIDAAEGDPGALREIADPLVPGSAGLWVKVAFYMDSVPGTDKEKYCNPDWGTGGDGTCRGFFRTHIPGSYSDHGTIKWQSLEKGGLGMEVFADPSGDPPSALGGSLPDRGSNQFTVTAGWLGDRGNKIYSGTDPAWTDAPGGPIDLYANYDPNDGYTFDFYGYVWALHGV